MTPWVLAMKELLKDYDLNNLTIGVLGSHSALEVCLGAKKEGFKTVVIAQKGREKTYKHYYPGIVDKALVLEKFKEVVKGHYVKELRRQNTIFIPHRSFEVYINDYDAIEKRFSVPVFGNRYLLRAEERDESPNQYDILKEGDIRYPKIFSDPKKIDRLVIVKTPEARRGFERAFFLTASYEEYKKKGEERIQKGIFSPKALKEATIEEFIIGVPVNFHYFYSPLKKRLELIGTDSRRQTNYEGLVHLPTPSQEEALKHLIPKFEEAGHFAVTVLESFLEQAFEIGERFVRTSKKIFPPGIIGPFTLQGAILPGPPKKEFVVFDVSPRIGGSPGIKATPYSEYLFGKPVSMGQRIAMEVREAVEEGKLKLLIT